MKPRDELTALAADYLQNRDAIARRVEDAFANIPRAPLAKLIDEFLEASPHIDVAPVLKKIADTNQGRLEDLNMPEFQSYLIATCGTNEIQLRHLTQALHNLLTIKASSANGNKTMLIAARDGDNSGQKSATMNDLLKQIAKRKR